MKDWFKEISASLKLKVANKKINDLKKENQDLKDKLKYLEDTFLKDDMHET